MTNCRFLGIFRSSFGPPFWGTSLSLSVVDQNFCSQSLFENNHEIELDQGNQKSSSLRKKSFPNGHKAIFGFQLFKKRKRTTIAGHTVCLLFLVLRSKSMSTRATQKKSTQKVHEKSRSALYQPLFNYHKKCIQNLY